MGLRGFESHAFRQYVHGHPWRSTKSLLSRETWNRLPWASVDDGYFTTLRAWPLDQFPYLMFYVAEVDRVEVWRVLHTRRDIQ